MVNAGVTDQIIESLKTDVAEVAQEIRNAGHTTSNVNNTANIAEFQALETSIQVRNAESKLGQINVRVEELARLTRELEREKTALEKQKEQLAREKAEIKQREDLFSMGFYTTVGTNILSLLGLIYGGPHAKLNRQIKLLEIEEERIRLDQLKNSLLE